MEMKDTGVFRETAPVVDPNDVVIEDDDNGAHPSAVAPAPRRQKDDPLADMRKRMEEAEAATAREREERERVTRERDDAVRRVDETRATLGKAENDKIASQESAIVSRLDAARAELENAERALEEAIDTGKPAKEQIVLQRKQQQAVYKLEGVERAKGQFDTWKEGQKNKKPEVAAAPVSRRYADQLSAPAKQWTASHPQFDPDSPQYNARYHRVAIGAAMETDRLGIPPDSKAYFDHIEKVLGEEGLGAGTAASPAPARSATSTAAPASQNSAAAGASGGSAAQAERTGRRAVKLDPAMKDMALKIYGKNTKFNIADPNECYRRYAARQLEIREKQAAGEM